MRDSLIPRVENAALFFFSFPTRVHALQVTDVIFMIIVIMRPMIKKNKPSKLGARNELLALAGNNYGALFSSERVYFIETSRSIGNLHQRSETSCYTSSRYQAPQWSRERRNAPPEIDGSPREKKRENERFDFINNSACALVAESEGGYKLQQ